MVTSAVPTTPVPQQPQSQSPTGTPPNPEQPQSQATPPAQLQQPAEPSQQQTQTSWVDSIKDENIRNHSVIRNIKAGSPEEALNQMASMTVNAQSLIGKGAPKWNDPVEEHIAYRQLMGHPERGNLEAYRDPEPKTITTKDGKQEQIALDEGLKQTAKEVCADLSLGEKEYHHIYNKLLEIQQQAPQVQEQMLDQQFGKQHADYIRANWENGLSVVPPHLQEAAKSELGQSATFKAVMAHIGAAAQESPATPPHQSQQVPQQDIQQMANRLREIETQKAQMWMQTPGNPDIQRLEKEANELAQKIYGFKHGQ